MEDWERAQEIADEVEQDIRSASNLIDVSPLLQKCYTPLLEIKYFLLYFSTPHCNLTILRYTVSDPDSNDHDSIS